MTYLENLVIIGSVPGGEVVKVLENGEPMVIFFSERIEISEIKRNK